jgi:Gpi18-like mannosyltransferase
MNTSVTVPRNNTLKVLAFTLALISILLRVTFIPYSNYDLAIFNLVWYETLRNDVLHALATNFANYTPPYTYFLALATFTRDFIPPLTAIKLIPTFCDMLGAFLIYKIVRLKYQNDLPYLAAAIYFTAPTIMINSSYWGQADSLYTAGLLACIYLLMLDRSFPAMLAFGAAFSFKAQAVFLAPFLLILALRKKINWLYFGLVPLVYLIAILPVVLLGRPLLDALLIYTKQSNTFASLTMNAPNFYYLLPREWRAVIVPLGIVIAAITLLYWAFNTARSKLPLENDNLLLLAVVSVALTPFLLPKMHDRYFYPADVLSIAVAFYFPQLWVIPVFYQIISATAISGFLFNASPTSITLAVLLNAITIAVILRAQRFVAHDTATDERIASALSWAATLITPLVLSGLCLNFTLTPVFLRMTYIPVKFNDGLEKSEGFHWASESVNYLTSDRKLAYLHRLKFENGKPVFNEDEALILDNVKDITQTVLKVWQILLLTLFTLGLLAWSGNWLPAFRQGMKRGGWLSIGLGIIFAIAGLTGMTILDTYLQGAGVLGDLFPVQVLQTALIFTVVGVTACGFLLTRFKTAPETQ